MKQRVKWKAAGILLSFAVLLAAAVPAQAAGEQVKASIPVAQKFSVSGGDDSVNSEFTYQLTPLEKENPMPEGSAQGMWSFQMVGNIETETKAITFDHAGVYAYQLRMAEEAEQEGYFFDEEVYKATFFVRNTQTGLAAELILQKTDAVDVLINNAGVWLDHDTGTILEDRIDYEAILEQIDVNALGALRVTQALIGAVLNSFDQLVVNVSSEAASMTECAKDSQFGYCMSKAALNMASCIVLNGIRKRGGAAINLHPGWMQSVIGESAKPDAPYCEPARPGEVKFYTTPEVTARGFLKILDEPERFSGHMPGFVNYRGDRMNW